MSDAWLECWLPDDLSYEGWIDYVFDHPVLDPQWWFQVGTAYCQEWNEEADPARTLSYLTRLFQNPGGLVSRFTRPQIEQGLNFLVSNACSNHMHVLRNTALLWAARRACFDAMITLYRDLMAPVYGNDLGHDKHAFLDPDRHNYACYMWWDIIPLYGGMPGEGGLIDSAVLDVFGQVLRLKSEACLESVLHGLGHWHSSNPKWVEAIIGSFLKRNDLSSELRRYAKLAARGSVQ